MYFFFLTRIYFVPFFIVTKANKLSLISSDPKESLVSHCTVYLQPKQLCFFYVLETEESVFLKLATKESFVYFIYLKLKNRVLQLSIVCFLYLQLKIGLLQLMQLIF